MASVTLAKELSHEEFVESYRHPALTGNAIRDLNPVGLVVVLVMMVVIGFTLPGAITPIILCAAFVVIAFMAGVGRAYFKTYSRLFLAVGLILFVFRAALLPGKTVLWQWGGIKVTVQSIWGGVSFSLGVMLICGAVTLFFAIVSMRNLMLTLENMGMSPRAAYVVLASFRAITDMGVNSKTVMEAQKARGIESEGSPFVRVKAFFPVLAPVFLTGLSQTVERALALDARAFGSRLKHTHLVILRKRGTGETVLIAIAVLLAVCSILGRILLWN